MRKVMIFVTLVMGGIALSVMFGLMILTRRISLYQMNHMKAFH